MLKRYISHSQGHIFRKSRHCRFVPSDPLTASWLCTLTVSIIVQHYLSFFVSEQSFYSAHNILCINNFQRYKKTDLSSEGLFFLYTGRFVMSRQNNFNFLFAGDLFCIKIIALYMYAVNRLKRTFARQISPHYMPLFPFVSSLSSIIRQVTKHLCFCTVFLFSDTKTHL